MKNKNIKKITAAYWQKDGLDIYSYAGDVPYKQASGNFSELKPVKKRWGIYALIVGRDRLMHLRKRYPPAPLEKLTKAVSLEIGELFPLAQPAFYCRVFKAISNYVELDIWAWETAGYEKIREVFPFNHVIPEDVLFRAPEPEVAIFQQRKLIHLIACGPSGFLDGASFPADGFSEGYIHNFLLGLSQSGNEIKKVKIYGLPSTQLNDAAGIALIRAEAKIFAPCLENLHQADFREFKIRGEGRFFALAPLVLRIGLYLVLGYILALFLTMKNYESATAKLRQQIGEIDRTATAWSASRPAQDYSEVLSEVERLLRKNQKPLKAMNMLAQKFPEGTFVNRLLFTENVIEIMVSSKEPLNVIKALEGVELVRKVTIKGPLSQDRTTGLYNFSLTLELPVK